MKREPVWMKDIRAQMKKTRFYGQMDEEREQYKKEYIKALKMLDRPKKRAIERYVQQVEKCEYHHIRIAYLEGIEEEKANHRIRRDQFYQIMTHNHMIKGAVAAKAIDLLLSYPEFSERYKVLEKNQMKLYALLRTLPENEQDFLRAYLQSLSDFYAVMLHVAAGLPKGIL